jgi:hypothetical protein
MDCIIPGHGVKTFTATLACLGRTGKDLYVEFTDYDGLSLKTVNDAKSAFSLFHFQPRFFERCSAPPTFATSSLTSSSSRKRSKSLRSSQFRSQGSHSQAEYDTAFTCRVPFRALHAILKSRKGIRSLRVRSHGHGRSSIHPHSNVTSNADEADASSSTLQLSFDFSVEPLSTPNATMRIVHRIGVAECDSIMAVTPPKDQCSEIVTTPQMFHTLLDPLRRTNEIAWTVRNGDPYDLGNDNHHNEEARSTPNVTVTSFHHMDAAAARAKSSADGTASAGSSELLAAQAALKTESIMGCHEFEGFLWRGADQVDGHEDDELPNNLRSEVSLVFGIREVRALLQFCTYASTNDDMRVSMSFEWGGKPIVFESEGKAFSAQLIMATLDHKLLVGSGAISSS